ncbi:hypothetical protein B7494_g3072 [Chlorociboria aeruginascens]|nr:hypothetical protein B7494_g3072 [Chlorociboria aeruginascens]
MPRAQAADTIRILIATDSHVGYAERDPIRKNDSWQSFDEIMNLARTQDVDMVLLAGDLFHDNKPSRKAMYQVMRSLRQNCLGDKPCELEMLSDGNEIFGGAFNHVNYEDPDINVAIPVFSIHGNHDDPTGDGAFCALDLLQVSGLMNYFGRTPEADRIDIKPVLLQKGNTKLALYGMSNVRDERLFRTFRDGHVKFFKPGVQQTDWFNLMAVHQNHHGHTETGYLPENFLPDFMDLIVWGHEHECLIDPRQNPEMQFHVMQPGSSVATSLCPGEAMAKHVAVISVIGKEFKVEKHRIKSVRPFAMKEMVLSDEKPFLKIAKSKENRSQLTLELEKIVNKLIEQAIEEWRAIQDEDDMPDAIPLPLIRLRVEYSAPEGGHFDIENPQRFSNRFIGKVANVNDVVQFYRKKSGGSRKTQNGRDLPEDDVIASMNSDTVKVDKVIREYLEAQELILLPKAPFSDAVTQFVEKDDKHYLEAFVDSSLKDYFKEVIAQDEAEEEDLDNAMERFRLAREAAFKTGEKKKANKQRKRKLLPKPDTWNSDIDGKWVDEVGAFGFTDGEESEEDTPAPARARTTASRRRAPSVPLDFSDDDMPIASVAPTKKAPAKRAPAKKAAPKKAPAKPKATGRGRNKVIEPSNDEDDDAMMLDKEPPPVKSQPKRAAAKPRQTQLNFAQSQAKTQTARELSDDEISDDEDAFEPMVSSTRRR